MKWTVLSVVVIAIAARYLFFGADKFNRETLRGKRVLVTGASSGIGEHIAYHYARAGANVVITARRQHLLEKVIENCKRMSPPGSTFDFISRDMNNPENAQQVIETAVDRLGGLDHVILNHALVPDLNYWTGTEQNFTLLNRMFDINFKSHVYLASYALPHLKLSKGNIAAISSMGGKIAMPLFLPYSSSKYALDGFFSGLRQELIMQKHDVSVTFCVLGLINTEHVSKMPQKVIDQAPPAPVSDTALEIIRATTLRLREITTPRNQYGHIVLMLRDWLPELLEQSIRSSFVEGN